MRNTTFSAVSVHCNLRPWCVGEKNAYNRVTVFPRIPLMCVNTSHVTVGRKGRAFCELAHVLPRELKSGRVGFGSIFVKQD